MADVENNQPSTPTKMLGGITGKGFKPGQSGNPGGRPKRDIAAEIAQAIFEGNAETIRTAMLDAVNNGNHQAFTALADRAYGKALQRNEISGPDGGPVAYQPSNLAQLSAEELKALESIARKLASPERDSSRDSTPTAE